MVHTNVILVLMILGEKRVHSLLHNAGFFGISFILRTVAF